MSASRKPLSNTMTPRHLFIAGVAVIAIATGAWLSYRIVSPPPQTIVATVLPQAGELPEFSLLDQTGRPVGRDVFVGQWDLLFFGFTNCPDICPLTLQALAAAKQQLAAAGFEPLPRIVLVSVDPERDTPDVIGPYVDHFGAGNLGLTGDLVQIRKLTDSLGIYFAKTRAEGGIYSVDHSAVVLLIDPDGRFRALFGSPHKPANFVHDLPIIVSRR
jgi:protein SCO1